MLAGGFQFTVTERSPRVVPVTVGAVGVVHTVIGAVAALKAPSPAVFMACTRKVYDTPAVKPVKDPPELKSCGFVTPVAATVPAPSVYAVTL